MKKQKIQMLVIVVILLLGVAAYFAASRYTKAQEQRDKDTETEGQVTLTIIDPDEIDSFSYDMNGKTYSYTKAGDTWTCENDTDLKMDSDSISQLLANLKEITASETLDTYDSLSDYGFDQPEKTITVTCGNDTTTFELGAYNDMLSRYYMKVSGDDKLYLVNSVLDYAFSKAPDALAQQENSTETEAVYTTEN